jgi:hypothetical protein
MTTKKITCILVLTLVLIALILVALKLGDQPPGPMKAGGQPPGSEEWVKPTTHLLRPLMETATAEAEKATPEPQGLRIPSHEAPSESPSGIERWWFDVRFPKWVSA